MSKKQERASTLAAFHNLFVNQKRNSDGGVTLTKTQIDALVTQTEALLKLDGYSLLAVDGVTK
ncbi:hypothetical protein [Pseudoalteromonas sp. Of7M-16]|uniref:hypothetical protein n=1 Tax=Pseudoalteromonas sp. Of7M-16 TaxID=2917756 RepID=UPI001EF54755|nr:hypothetical protein [Pseudoalteromonas sp. Of7M-16]MCG7548231.1 hypothetical protein [Pseudoalteromonas sp. Of7M-16]